MSPGTSPSVIISIGRLSEDGRILARRATYIRQRNGCCMVACGTYIWLSRSRLVGSSKGGCCPSSRSSSSWGSYGAGWIGGSLPEKSRNLYPSFDNASIVTIAPAQWPWPREWIWNSMSLSSQGRWGQSRSFTIRNIKIATAMAISRSFFRLRMRLRLCLHSGRASRRFQNSIFDPTSGASATIVQKMFEKIQNELYTNEHIDSYIQLEHVLFLTLAIVITGGYGGCWIYRILSNFTPSHIGSIRHHHWIAVRPIKGFDSLLLLFWHFIIDMHPQLQCSYNRGYDLWCTGDAVYQRRFLASIVAAVCMYMVFWGKKMPILNYSNRAKKFTVPFECGETGVNNYSEEVTTDIVILLTYQSSMDLNGR